MTENLRIRSATIVHDGTTYRLTEGPIPDDTPKAVVDQLRDVPGALGPAISPDEPLGVGTLGHDAFEGNAAPRPAPTSVATGFPEGAPDPDGSNQPGADSSAEGGGSGGSSSELPGDAPDAATADVAELAAYIDANNLNAAQTVALAGGTPEGAAKVIEAEQTSSGGDGRTTVVGPLERQRDAGTT